MALQLAGGGEGVSIDGAVTVTKNQSVLTGCLWFKQKNTSITGDVKLIDYTVFGSINGRYSIQYFSATPGQIGVGGRATDGEGIHTVTAPNTFTGGIWHHVVAVLDYANSIGTVYFDGVLAISTPVTAAPFAASQTANTNSENSGGSGGAIGVRANATQSFLGEIEDMRLYNRTISGDEAATIYAAKGADGIVSGLLHRYPMIDGAPGDILGGGLGQGTVCVAEPERIRGTAMAGTPTYIAGIISGDRMRTRHPRGSR